MRKISNSRILLFIIAVLLMSNISMLLFWYSMTRTDHRSSRGDMGWSPMSSFLEKKIGFSKEQMKQFETLRSEHRKNLKPMFEDLKLAKTNFYRLLNQSSPSDSIVSAEATIIGNKQKALDFRTFTNFRQLRQICTDQQRPVYDSLIPGLVSDMWFPNRRGMDKSKSDSSRKSRP
ncbi:MAG: hypothetical protein ABI151_10380 [Chitinophagaceae bacterium]